MDQDLADLQERLATLERRAEQARDRLLIEITAKVRDTFDPILRDVRTIKAGLDRLRELHSITPDYLPALTDDATPG